LPDELNDPQSLLADDAYCAEEMLSGQRLLVSKYGSAVRGFCAGRIGHTLPLAVVNLARSLSDNFILDGEIVHDSFIAFDILAGSGATVCAEPFAQRRKLLESISPFPMVAHAIGEKDKTALLERVRAARGAGIVFKRLDGPYRPEQHLYGVKFKNNGADTISIEKCSLGLQRGGKPNSGFLKKISSVHMQSRDARVPRR
jgi:ATP-dependent DNA ligase